MLRYFTSLVRAVSRGDRAFPHGDGVVEGPRVHDQHPICRREQCARGPILPTLGDHEQGEPSGSTKGTVT